MTNLTDGNPMGPGHLMDGRPMVRDTHGGFYCSASFARKLRAGATPPCFVCFVRKLRARPHSNIQDLICDDAGFATRSSTARVAHLRPPDACPRPEFFPPVAPSTSDLNDA